LSKLLPAWGETEPEIGGTIADALNSVYRQAQFLERVLKFLSSLGDLAPPCAVVPLSKARAKLVTEAADLRRTLIPVAAPEIREAMTRSLDALDAQIAKIPSDLKMWTEAPSQWQAGAYEGATAVPTRALGWSASGSGLSWADAKAAALALLDVGTAAWLITTGPPGALIAGLMYSGGIGDAIVALAESRVRDVAPGLKAVLASVLAEAVKFEQRTKPSVYQQVLGAWMLTRTSSSPEVMREAMAVTNPYILPPMPETWDGSFDHLLERGSTASGSWLIALLLGGFLGLSVAALTE
jgi:hypothetical protein